MANTRGEREKFIRPRRNNARQFDYQLTSHHPRVHAASQAVFDLLEMPGKHRRQALKLEGCRRFLLNLYTGWLSERPTICPADRNYYPKYAPKKYYGNWCSHRLCVAMRDAHERTGLLTTAGACRWYEHVKGKKVWKGLSGTIAATENLIKVFDQYEFDPDILERKPLLDCIVLRETIERDWPKKDLKANVGYQETEFTGRARSVVQSYNSFMGDQEVCLVIRDDVEWTPKSLSTFKTQFGIDLQDEYALSSSELWVSRQHACRAKHGSQGAIQFFRYYTLNPAHLRAGQPNLFMGLPAQEGSRRSPSLQRADRFFDRRIKGYLTLSNLDLRRIFLNRFNLCGRYYLKMGADHNYQNLTKQLRNFILINGLPTSEPDFKCHHVRLLYHKHGMDFRGDAYACGPGKELGKVMKTVVQIIFNCKNRGASVRKTNEYLNQQIQKGKKIPPDWDGQFLIGIFENFHNLLRPYLWDGTGNLGRDLMFIDSQITEQIIMKHLEAHVPILISHDGYRTPLGTPHFFNKIKHLASKC
jgi:hypothetical protein